MIVAVSGFLGYRSGQKEFHTVGTMEARVSLDEQYRLGVEDMQAGNLDLARQRFEFIVNNDPNYEAAKERWLEVMLVMNKTATSTSLPSTITPTPTIDLRPSEELYSQAKSLIAAGDWEGALDFLAALRKTNPTYMIIEVDGLIYLALRNRGLEKITTRGELEGGLYDFALAEKFAPLDNAANNFRTWARYYLMGNGFWVAYPDTAAYYYGLAASGAPSLRDASGMTAFYRYWASLMQYGDLLAEENWCDASEQYVFAMQAWAEPTAAMTATNAYYECLALTPSSTPTSTETTTATVTMTGFPYTSTPTSTLDSTTTPTPTMTNTTTQPITPSITTTPATFTPTPTPTPEPTSTPTPTPGS
jgi:tetratricopeptide (TPR) repeat protein